MEELIYCNTLFCPLLEGCKRKSFIGKPYDPNLPFADFSSSLKYNKEEDEWCCDNGIEVDCK
jgi:hypothetical protein